MENRALTDLIIKAQSGDQAAMEELLRTAHTSVSYQCRKMMRNPRDAEDMIQEVLLTVYTRLDKLKNPAAFWGWLNTITANRCVNQLRRGNMELQFAEDEDGHSVLDDLEELDEQQVPDKALDNTETTRMIEEIVDSLPDAQRICVLMYYYDEMSVKNIAETLGVPENTVKSRLNYARKAVKERVLDYEKKGVKLYGLSPLSFLLFFLRRAADGSADSAAAGTAARRVMEMGALAGGAAAGTAAGGTAAAGGTSAVVGASSAAGAAVSHGLGGLSIKLAAALLAGLLAVGGVTAAVVTFVRNREEPESGVTETQAVPEGQTAAPALTEEMPGETQEPVADDLIPAERLALLNEISYYGDPAQCRMTVNQALAYAEVIETRTAELVPAYEDGTAICYAALIDVGEGNPVLALVCGTIYGEIDGGYIGGGNPGPDYHSGLDGITGKMEVWQYADGQAEMVATAHKIYWKAGEGFVFHTRVGGTNDEDGNVFPMEAQSHYLDFSEDAYRVEGGVLSASPVSSALVEIDLREETVVYGGGGIIDGQNVGDAVWPAWKQQWGESGRKSIVIAEDWVSWSQYWIEDGWTSIGIAYDATLGGYVDEGAMNFESVSPGADAAAVLRQCAGE